MKYIKNVFKILSVLFLGYFVIGQLVLPSDVINRRGICKEYDGEIWAIDKNGNKKLEKNLVKIDELSAIETVLPEDIDSRTNSIGFGGKCIRAYVDGELVYKTKQQHTGWFTKVNPEHYMMIPISDEDAGKTLRIEFDYEKGVFYQMYIGSEFGIWSKLLLKYSGELIVALMTLVMGCMTIVISKIYEIIAKKNTEITYLCVGVVFTAMWMVSNSIYRQVIFSNLSIASDFPFLMVMLLPFPYLIYMNTIQEKRFERLYVLIGTLIIGVDITSCAFYVLGKKELNDMFLFVAISCGTAIVSVISSFVMDLKSGKIKEYKFVAFGLAGTFSLAIVQLVTYFFRKGVFSGGYLAIGLLCLLGCAAVHTINNVFSIEKDKQAAIIANEAKDKFLSSMSHEIRTPINAVLGMDEMILREAKDVNIRDYALDIQNAGKSLLALINDILDISKIESGKMEIIPVEYDMSSLLNDTMNMIYHKAKEKDLYANINVDSNIPSRFKGDDIRIRQVLINILNNAVKYTVEGGVLLDVSFDKKDNNTAVLHFKIQDTGIGIKEEDLPKLYERFERIEENRNRNVEGTGLGMNITLQLLELMDSKLNVESEYGKGSCFYFDLEQEIMDETPIGELSKRISEQKKEYNFKNAFYVNDVDVLVVDDNSVNRKVVRNLLKNTGIRIDEADSGERCLEMVCEKRYDMIFLDHMMPGLDGIQTLHEFSKLENNLNQGVPVIALTANAITGAKEMYINEGFDDFLTKPVIYSKLENMLLKYISEEKVVPIHEEMEKTFTDDIGKEDNGIGGNEEDDIAKIREILEEIPEMNMEYALMLNGSEEVLFDTLSQFVKMIDYDINEINRFRELLPDVEAIKQYRVKVHAIKSSAMLVGQMYLGGMARMLELAAINGDIELIEATHDAFVNELQKMKLNCSILFGNEEKEEEVELVEANMKLVHEQLNMLEEAVENVDVDRADEIVELLKGFSYPEDISEKMEKIYTAVINLDDGIINEVIQELK